MQERVIKNLESTCRKEGVSLFGICGIEMLKGEFVFSSDVLEGLTSAVSIGFRLSGKVLKTVESRPTAVYYHHYRSVNDILDQTALRISSLLQGYGFMALPVPASQIIDWEKQRGHLSHKKVALEAGLGWLGRNNLLVTPGYGAQVRLATVLTDLPLPENNANLMENGCGRCRMCLEACPAHAIKERQEDFDHLACYEQLKAFRKAGYTSQFICGICVRSCAPKKS